MGLRKIYRRLVGKAHRLQSPLLKSAEADPRAAKHPLVLPRDDVRMHRKKLTSEFGKRGLTLEIGPYFAPMVRGSNARYFDVFDSEELKRRADKDPNSFVTAATVPEMHYTDPDGDISTIPETFAEVVSSHSLEHQPDLITHLEKVYDRLDAGGRYVAIVPDKRFCFDHFASPTSLGDVVEAYEQRRTRHTLSSIIQLFAGSTHNDPSRHWAGDHADPDFRPNYASRLEQALELYRNSDGSYIDCHAWRFTPDSFAEICQILFEAKLIRLRLSQVGDTRENTQEFSAIFLK
jgi:hypothetical protein